MNSSILNNYTTKNIKYMIITTSITSTLSLILNGILIYKIGDITDILVNQMNITL